MEERKDEGQGSHFDNRPSLRNDSAEKKKQI